MSVFDYLFDSDWIQRADLKRLDDKAEALEMRLWSERSRCQHFNPFHLKACQYCGRLFGPA